MSVNVEGICLEAEKYFI